MHKHTHTHVDKEQIKLYIICLSKHPTDVRPVQSWWHRKRRKVSAEMSAALQHMSRRALQLHRALIGPLKYYLLLLSLLSHSLSHGDEWKHRRLMEGENKGTATKIDEETRHPPLTFSIWFGIFSVTVRPPLTRSPLSEIWYFRLRCMIWTLCLQIYQSNFLFNRKNEETGELFIRIVCVNIATSTQSCEGP